MTKNVDLEKPFYLDLWWHMSHDTIDPRPEQYTETFPFNTTCLFPAKASCSAAGGGDSKTSCEPCNWQVFWGAQTWSDMHRIGPVIDAIDHLGIRDNTYIIFSSDNGAQGERWTSNAGGSGPNRDTSGAFSNAVGTQGPFRGCKASLYEGGHRVPFIVSGPGVPKGRIDHSTLSAVDWFSTIVSLADAAIPAGTLLRGTDVSAIWHGDENHKTERPHPLIWRGGSGPPPCWNQSPGLAIRNGDWKLLFNPGPAVAPGSIGRVELYNVSVASFGRNGAFFEAQNEADAQPAVVQAMAATALAWHHGTACPFGGAKGSCITPQNKAKWNPTGCEAYQFPGL